MSNEANDDRDKGIGGRECVPYFKTNKGQIIFEFWYLVVLLVAAAIIMFLIQFGFMRVEYNNKVFVYALFGGFLGGWVYDAKWFYRVTARGKDDQYKYLWQCHKFYWRVLTPFLSCLVAFVTYILISSGIFPIVLKNSSAAGAAFSICFIFGYFSDLVLSRLAAWAEEFLPKIKKKGTDGSESNE
ncbi:MULTISPECIES: hypothetical protein [Pseudomonas]|nr:MULTISPECIES: hypothetical protein [Pseudomonas]AZD93128.1 hypothetical protein C4K13_3712 [Pseudomonas chlororaphis subsp. aureofaciens]AZE36643.1 hypothetical protein C4K06_3611 [Pseudomonas chlororaphis subsp. aureofaciens]KAB0532710.1 hypothetical protein F7R16_10705 [Pseudomonas chlororaphis subsp. aureofaciens]TSD26102.1 hypothetical protein FCE86_032085 [Pseudomonas sp. ATCC 13985]WDG57931.1 hypothetical protein PUP52_18985 [Pseudomonas chlororaphis]